MPDNPTNHLSILDCFHTALLTPPPAEGDEVFCSRCSGYRLVVTVSAEWRIKCVVCHLGRPYGVDDSLGIRLT